jgi:uncharacterized protein YndB with AHSA1/START domain
MSFAPPIRKSVVIAATPTKVWNALTHTALMKQWMSDAKIDIVTDWKVGNSITIQGDSYKTRFENKGTVLQFEPERVLEYSHLSSLSRLPDRIENYTRIEFRLTHHENQTTVTLTLSNFPTESIYKHFAFYWNVTLELLKKSVE